MAEGANEMTPRATPGEGAGPSNLGRVSSPASTGGAGVLFEQHVDAFWLALLLVRGYLPILHRCVAEKVCMQTEYLGWHTDDFLVTGQDDSGNRRRLAGQVKRTFVVSASDDVCKKAVGDFWRDFRDPDRFSPDDDRFALVTLQGTKTLLGHFAGLLDCSRAAPDGAEFERRLAIPGFISTTAIRYCEELRKIIGEIEGRNVSVVEVWPFLRVLHVLSLDLGSATQQTEAVIKTLLAHTTSEQDVLCAAEASWNLLLREAGQGMSAARSYRREDLPEVLLQRHTALGGVERRALRALSDHSELILGGIRSTIGSDVHLERDRLVQQIIEQLESSQVVLISGAAGSGKSVAAKDAFSILANDHYSFSFRAEEFAHPHLDAALQSSQVPVSASTLGAILAGQGRKILLVESVERLLEKSTRDAFTDLLSLVASDRSWRMMLTCRDYSTDLVRECFLESASVGHSVVAVHPLDDEELAVVEAAHPTLTPCSQMQRYARFCATLTFSTRLCRFGGQRSSRCPRVNGNSEQSTGERSYVPITEPVAECLAGGRTCSSRSHCGARGHSPCMLTVAILIRKSLTDCEATRSSCFRSRARSSWRRLTTSSRTGPSSGGLKMSMLCMPTR